MKYSSINMASKKDIYHLWVQYTTKNEEVYFRKFVEGFVSIWESQLELDWTQPPDWSTVKHDSGPHLSRLPEELLPAISKFVYIAKERAEKGKLTDQSLEEIAMLLRCLVVICRNFDNIPFIASCDYVGSVVTICATLIQQQLVDEEEEEGVAGQVLRQFCRLLECLYDPYFTWRHLLLGRPADAARLPLQPALLHVEVVPFVYECFQTALLEKRPQLSTELLHVLGAVISGAQHNALRAICPATVNIVMGVISHPGAADEARQTAVQCFVVMARVLSRCSADQRQIEVGTILQFYQDSLVEAVSGEWREGSAQAVAGVVGALGLLLAEGSAGCQDIRDAMVDGQLLDTVVTVVEQSSRCSSERQMLATTCVKTITSILSGSSRGKERMAKTDAYERLFVALKTLGAPSRDLLTAVLSLATEDDESHTLQIAEVLLPLSHWLVDLEAEDQAWLAASLFRLCTTNLPSKALACRKGMVHTLCEVLSEHSRLSQKTAAELVKLLEALVSHSVSPFELKQIFLLLREDGKETFPYRVQLVRAISTVARKEDCFECSCYFDIQKNTDGISVPGIRKWPGAGYGFSFHCWVRLDSLATPTSSSPTNYRRQLFNLLTNGGTGLQAFLKADGTLVVGMNTRKEFLAASVPDYPLLDGQWHCVSVCHIAARRPFGQNQIIIYIDGVQRMGASIKSPSMTDPFTFCSVGSALPRTFNGSNVSASDGRKLSSGERGLFPGVVMDRGLLPSFINQVPNYFTLPLRSSVPLDPSIKSFPAGMQDTVWGTPTSLRGQVALVCLFHEALTSQQAKILYEGGPNCELLFSAEEHAEYAELNSKLVFCFSPLAFWDTTCIDLAPGNKYDGCVVASHCHTTTIKKAINGIGGVHVLFPILENASKTEDTVDLSFVSPAIENECKLLEGREGSVDSDEWEILPSSSYSDWKLEQNPVSGFLSLLKNIVAGSSVNQEQLMKRKGLAIIGVLLSRAKPHLIDVNVLMAAQLLVEMSRDAATPNPALLRSLYQHVLFNFSIWARSQFHIIIGHVQYISTVIRDDRKFFRKRYGVQFLLDVIRQHYAGSEVLTPEDTATIRVSLLALVRYYLQKELSVKDVSAVLSFLSCVKKEVLLAEVLDMLTALMEGKSCSDQLFLLMYEPHSAESVYCLLLEKSLSMELKQKVLKFLSVLLRSERVYDRYKARLRLQDSSMLGPTTAGMYPGLVSAMLDQELSATFVALLMDQILLTETSGGYAGALSLLHALSEAPLELKLEAVRKILTATFMKPNAANLLAKQVGWQDCITRLLVKRPIMTASVSRSESLPDLMSFDEEQMELDGYSDSPLTVSRLSSQVTDAALVIENEMKEVAETVTNVTSAVADNIHYAADNISSAVASAYSVFRQKTVEMQESLEELGESAVSRLKKRRSLLSLYEEHEEPASPLPPASLALDLDSLSIGNRSQSSSSTEDLSSPNQFESFTVSARDNLSISSAQSIPAGGADEGDTEASKQQAMNEEKVVFEALKQWQQLDEEKMLDQEEELCYLVVHILFTVMWRGVDGASKESWKERGQVMACINLLALNNELLCSHLLVKLRLLEMAVQAQLADLRDPGQSLALSVHAENTAQLLRWTYDLAVLDPCEDMRKKASVKLLDGVLGLLDVLMVFQEGPGDEWTEMAQLAFGILLSCAASSDLDLCAVATAKLHGLVQTRVTRDPQEAAYMLYVLHVILRKTIDADNQEHYSFLIPVVKALLDKLGPSLGLRSHLPDLPATQSGPAFFDDFQRYCLQPQWTSFMEKKVRPLHDCHQAALSAQLTELMNTFWAECYEASKVAVHRRSKEVADSRRRFEKQVVLPCEARQVEEAARYGAVLSQRRQHDLQARRRWRHIKQFLSGPRGAWQSRSPAQVHWKLSHHENFSRMRLKLVPTAAFNPHTDASNLRDNSGWLSRMQSEDIPLSLNLSSAAVRGEAEPDSLVEEELRLVSEAENEGVEESGKEKMIISQECELVTLMSVVKGRLDLTTSHVHFCDLSPVKDDVERQDFKWALTCLREVHLRRYNLRRSALEFFLIDQTNYFLNFSTKTRNKVFTRILSLRPPSLVQYSSRSPADLLRSSGLTQKWVNRELSNFDYLMQLNTLAGRTYNDLSQYPVFPWVLADYTSQHLDLDDPGSFRDLSRPIGVVNPKNVAEVKAKYDSFEDPSGTVAKFHYGTHYSNSAGVLHYLVRVEPFTSLHVELQSGRFDVADRQFHSIPQTWKLLMDNPNDVKELIPEFFYFPEFLKNMNKFDLGLLQSTKERVNDVILPKWASSPEDFIYKHRKALESEYVSAHLHEWIDLIFGYKQKGPRAVEAFNVFYYCSYEGAVDLDAIANPVEREAVEGMINNFGQTPSQLLRDPHPHRLALGEFVARVLRLELKKGDFSLFLDHLRPVSVEVSTDKDPLVFLSVPRSPPRGFLQTGMADTVVSVSRGGSVGAHAWQPFDRHSNKGFSLEVDSSLGNAKTRKRLSGPFHPSLPLGSQLFVVSHDARFLFSGGHWDSSLRVYSLVKNKTVASVRHHFDLVTCVALDRCGLHLATGSRDTTCVVWDVAGGATSPRPLHTLHGHDRPVSCVAVATELDMVVSGSQDGTVNVHTIQEGQYLRTVEPVGCQGLRAEITFLALSSQGHVAFAAASHVTHSLHVFSVNGESLGSKLVSGQVTGLAVAGDHLVVVDDAGDLTVSRLLGLHPVYDLPLHVPIQSVVVTAGNTHLLLPLRDGKVVVLTVVGS
ncbi:neurobeachin-like protein 1 isoform X2 [Bacillus rossius redtenbacheri]|uniref:neurobeachin-like protein 1 isoform X2 n=1 Tax=Bacillus rossius redtenbacheri TaxID=93214 RepID=UPI002FDCC1D3